MSSQYTTDKIQMMTVPCSEAGCTNCIICPRVDPGPALRRVDWSWDGLAAKCRDHA